MTQPISIPFNLRQLAATQPDAIAVVVNEERLSYGELHRRSNRIARALSARGVREGDLVTVALPNGIPFVEACYGIWKVGAVPQPVSWRLPRGELDAIVALAKPPLIIAEFSVPSHPTVGVEVLLDHSPDESDLPDRISPSWKAPTSGGSTGRPKLIVAAQKAIVTDRKNDFWKLSSRSVSLIPGPMYHNGPFICTFMTIQSGGTAIVMPRFDAETMLKQIDRHRVTWMHVVPTMMVRVARLPEEVRRQYDLSSIEIVWHGSAPCPAWVKELWIDWFGGDRVIELYGGTEGQAVTMLNGDEWRAHRGSVGRVVSGEIKIVSPEGRDLAANETGDVYMRAAAGGAKTYRYVGAESKATVDGWETLGDVGWFDEDGYLYLADRRTDMILVGGSNVYPAEVEAALEEYPFVQSSAVIGLPDEDMGARVHAILQIRDGFDLADLKRHLAERLVPYKWPRSYEYLDTPLRDDAGKVRRSALREERISR